jgi:hypothetical protein
MLKELSILRYMNNQPNLSFTPEAQLADRFLIRIPRIGAIDETELQQIINWADIQDANLYNNYHDIALKSLIDEGYLLKDVGLGINRHSTKYTLTKAGRQLKDEGGYILSLIKKGEKESFSNKINNAEGKKKIFDNKMKIFLFLLACAAPLIGVISFWKKYSSSSDILSAQEQVLPTVDSNISTHTKPSKPDNKLKVVHSVPVQPPPLDVETKPKEPTTDTSVNTPSVINQLIEITTSDNIEFKLTKAEGNSKAQTIKITMVLTTSAANWYIMSAVKSIIDPEGNEYKLKSFTNGASDYLRNVDLMTGVPIKCTYTFGGVLPDVKRIKLFSYSYTHSWGEPFAVEFRDIPVDWK